MKKRLFPLVGVYILYLTVGSALAGSNLSSVYAMIKDRETSQSVEDVLKSVLDMAEAGDNFSTRKELRIKNDSSTESSALEYCRDDELGVRLLCDPQWYLQAEKDSLFLIISQIPRVTLEIAKLDTGMISLSQLSRMYFDEEGYYQDGFAVEDVRVKNFPAIKVKAFSKDFPAIRIVDYYFLKGSDLYGLFFSVEPKEEWDRYKFLFQEVAQSFVFL